MHYSVLAGNTVTRVVLFLQGPPGGFWRQLAEGFEAAGHKTVRVNLCLGDQLFWRKNSAINYRGGLDGWDDWLSDLVEAEGVTDILYYADQLPYHRIARAVAERKNIRPWVMEFGYLRPDWLTLEPGGMGRASTWPKDRQTILALAENREEPDMAPLYPHRFFQEAQNEVLFNLLTVFGWPFFPRYKSDKYIHPIVDYLSWLLELTRGRGHARMAEGVEAECADPDFRYHLVAMQLQSDYQIRASTDYGHLSEMLDEVISSFKVNGRPDQHLVFKLHPLDNGSENWSKQAFRIAARHGVANRIRVIKGGDLDRLIRFSDGVILANSTVGLHALRLSKPVIALGDAIYDARGLTHQGGLDTFWRAPEPIDAELSRALLRAMAAHIQVKGSFYHAEGRRVAVKSVVERLTAPAGDAVLEMDSHMLTKLAG